MVYQRAKSKVKPPVPKYQYKLATVSSSREAQRMEKALCERLASSTMSFFAICHQNGQCDVMGDSGSSPLGDADLKDARAAAARIKQA